MRTGVPAIRQYSAVGLPLRRPTQIAAIIAEIVKIADPSHKMVWMINVDVKNNNPVRQRWIPMVIFLSKISIRWLNGIK